MIGGFVHVMPVTHEISSPARARVSPMESLYRRVAEAGFKREFVRRFVLPSWWDDTLAQTETGFAHGALLVSRYLGVEVESLLDSDGAVTLGQMGKVCFKASAVAEVLRPATSVALSAARLLSRAVTTPVTEIPSTAAKLREILLARGSVVTLDSVVAWCWDAGIPVLHLQNLPGAKPQALCLRYKGRPYVFLFDGHNLSAWQVFHLLHELGHVCSGHLNEENSLCVDEKIERGDTQAEESQANAFAVEALLGNAEIQFDVPDRFTAEQLAQAARSHGAAHRLDAGAIVLNAFHYDKDKKRVARNMKAASLLEPTPPALARIGAQANRRLEWDNLSEDDAAYLRCLAGLEQAGTAPQQT